MKRTVLPASFVLSILRAEGFDVVAEGDVITVDCSGVRPVGPPLSMPRLRTEPRWRPGKEYLALKQHPTSPRKGKR